MDPMDQSEDQSQNESFYPDPELDNPAPHTYGHQQYDQYDEDPSARLFAIGGRRPTLIHEGFISQNDYDSEYYGSQLDHQLSGPAEEEYSSQPEMREPVQRRGDLDYQEDSEEELSQGEEDDDSDSAFDEEEATPVKSTRGGRGRGRGRGVGRGRGRGRGSRGGPGSRGGRVSRSSGRPVGRPRKDPNAPPVPLKRKRVQKASSKAARGAEPEPEFKLMHTDAITAYVKGDYEEAIRKIKIAITINPEIFPAHALYSELLADQGRYEEATAALFTGAHVRPSDTAVWEDVARRILEFPDLDRQVALKDALYCYSRVIEHQPDSEIARLKRAEINAELGSTGKAFSDLAKVLLGSPYDLNILRSMAEMAELDDELRDMQMYYETAIAHYMELEPQPGPDASFSWDDANVYLDTFGLARNWDQGIQATKGIARWLLGRSSEAYWNNVVDNDCEYDVEDSPRRIKQNGFVPGQFPNEAYGAGLPLEIRVKLGLFRLESDPEHVDEARAHFEWLDPDNAEEDGKIWDYDDLFLEVGEALFRHHRYQEALRFLEPVQLPMRLSDIDYFVMLGKCLESCPGRVDEAARCYQTIIENDEYNIEARLSLISLIEKSGDVEKAYRLANETVLIGRSALFEKGSRKRGRKAKNRDIHEIRPAMRRKKISTASKPVRSYKDLPEGERPLHGADWETSRLTRVLQLYETLKEATPLMREGDEDAQDQWLDAAEAMIRDFRSNRIFYPFQRYDMFTGFNENMPEKIRPKGPLAQAEDLAMRLRSTLADGDGNLPPLPMPGDYRGISFGEWLDIFLEYALLLASNGEKDEAFEAIGAASDASVYYHDKQSMLYIQTCRLTCALRLRDELALGEVSRWFTREYQFSTSAYQIFAGLARMSRPTPAMTEGKGTHYGAGSTMKYILRQVKTMDLSIAKSNERDSLVSKSKFKDQIRHNALEDQAILSLSTKDEQGNLIPAEELDVALLVLYGHICYSGGSYTSALAYLSRGYALDPNNPTIILTIALSYIHQSLKRQAGNRHRLINIGLGFLTKYRSIRLENGVKQEMQEAHFNTGRIWHTLGLEHMAIPEYQKVLELSEEIQAEALAGENAGDGGYVEDFGRDAALALQQMYAMNGQALLAREITHRYLVF